MELFCFSTISAGTGIPALTTWFVFRQTIGSAVGKIPETTSTWVTKSKKKFIRSPNMMWMRRRSGERILMKDGNKENSL